MTLFDPRDIADIVEDLLPDTVTIYRPPDRASKTVDSVTLEVTGPTPVLIYDGRALVIPYSALPTATREAGQQVDRANYRMIIPYGFEDDLEQMDDVEITDSIYHVGMIGITFLVQEEVYHSLYPGRQFIIERRDPVRRT